MKLSKICYPMGFGTNVQFSNRLPTQLLVSKIVNKMIYQAYSMAFKFVYT